MSAPSFPVFRKFWLEKPSPNLSRNIFYAVILVKLLFFGVYIALDGYAHYPIIDADGYDLAARGLKVDARSWPTFLGLLNDWGLYSRLYLRIIIFVSSCTLVPYLIARIIRNNNAPLSSLDWWALIAVSLYPSLTFFSLDIIRDLPMVVLFLLFIVGIRPLLDMRSLNFSGHLTHIVMLGFLGLVIFKLRAYLVPPLVLSLVACYLIDFKKRILPLILALLLGLIVLDGLHLFDVLKYEVRPHESSMSKYAFGIDFREGYFLNNLLLSFFANVLGVYFKNAISLLFFIFESLPVLLGIFYLLKNRVYFDRLVGFLVIFFFLYPIVWMIGIDVLGTAIRYRIFSYLALLVACCLVYKIKQNIPMETGILNTSES